MNSYTELYETGYERVVRCDNRRLGFSAWIAIHSLVLGPALGGLRVWSYPSDTDAVRDVLRLSKGMTYKNALARLELGGGKGVVRVDLAAVDRTELFEALGDFVDYFDGAYITAEDVNTTVADMAIIKRRTEHVATVGASGDPSPFTAYGVYCAIQSAVAHAHQRNDLSGIRVAIQGVGQTGARLAELLAQAGCHLIVCDINEDSIRRLSHRVRFETVAPEHIYACECDIFAPCAFGAILNEQTIPHLRCSIVAGSANNQLASRADGEALFQRNIIYIPDYAANAGGVINISCEIGQVYNKNTAYRKTSHIGAIVREILEQATQQAVPPERIAQRMAEAYLTSRALVH